MAKVTFILEDDEMGHKPVCKMNMELEADDDDFEGFMSPTILLSLTIKRLFESGKLGEMVLEICSDMLAKTQEEFDQFQLELEGE